jgi:hypothetical protein
MDFRTMAAKLATSVPQLSVYENLELHFEWICDGCIKGMVEENLPRELMFLEKYLLSIGQENLTSTINTFARDCYQHVDASGSTYRWVGILRAAEKHWKTTEEHSLFRSELEGINGTSPQIMYKTHDR